MNKVIAILDFGVSGNIFSIVKALDAIGIQALIVNNPEELFHCSHLIIPGVGSFADAMHKLNASKMNDAIIELAASGKPILGICLGMQILASVGFEYGMTPGLNLIQGEVRPMQCNDVVPHMRFNNISFQTDSPLFNGVERSEQFYFMHSYELINYTNVIALTEYSGHQFVSVIQHGNLYGVQFHPEKSRVAGLKIFKNFVEL